jgi:serine/threonine-protein kinase
VRERIRDRYRLEAIIGEGGYGRVYRAFDEQLGRKVALKLLTGVGGDPEAKARFQREAKLIRRLKHPHIVRVFDFGEDEGTDYIAYELLEGLPLSKLLGEPFPETRCANIAEQLLEGLCEVHYQGIVHRDIKPANVLITREGSTEDHVKLLDFGVSKLFSGARGGGTALTGTGEILGSPRYLAPEQVIDSASVSPATDLYAVGLVMAEMLSGKPVAQGAAVLLLMELVETENARLPEVVTHSRLGAIIRRATEKDRSRRYASANDMLADLEKAMAQRPLDATLAFTVDDATLPLIREPPAPIPVRAALPARRSIGWVVLAIVVLVALIAALVVATRTTS